MTRINSNISSLIAQANLGKTQKELQLRLERLSTGLRINRGSDDPAGLITSERIRSDIQGISQGIKNSDRAASVIATTESGLTEVADLLNSIKSLIVESANSGAISQDERQANQLQIDSAIDSITRISNTSSFGGLKLLNGSLDYTTSGLSTSAISLARIHKASFVGQPSLQVDVDVVASAQVGALYYNGGTTPPGVTLSAMTLQVTGTRGVEVITIPSGQPLQKMVEAVNNLTSLTGVTAELMNGDPNSGLVFRSQEYGSDSFVSVERLQGPPAGSDSWTLYKYASNGPVESGTPFPWSALVGAGTLVTGKRDEGQDVSALVNGNLASGHGLRLSINSTSLGMELLLHEDLAIRPTAANATFSITGGGALFQLGQDVTALQQANIGIQSVAASQMGGTLVDGSLQFLSSLKQGQINSIDTSFSRKDFSAASDILDRAIDEVSILRGRLGAFQRNVLETNSRALQSSFENLSASDSQIRDADFAFETSKLTRAQILSSAGNSALLLANQASQQVLQLLG